MPNDQQALSTRAKIVLPSATLAISAKAQKMKTEGKDVVGFGAGEPDFDTPDHIKQAGIEAIEKGFTKYTPSSGTLELRQAIAGKFKKDNGLDYKASQIVVSSGAKHSITNVILALVEAGDEVIIPAPYWVSYPEIVKIAGGTPVIVPTLESEDFCLKPEVLKKAITPKTKLLVLCSPSNPTGSMYSPAQLKALAGVLEGTGVYVLSDEIYEKLIYGDARHVSFGSLSADAFGRTLTINGVSKAYSMTGWRIGYCSGPEAIMRAVDNLQSQSTSNPCSISQKASLAALNGPQADTEKMRQAFDERRQAIVKLLRAIPGVRCVEPKGAFYAFPNVSAVYGKSRGDGKITGSMDFADALLRESLVAVVPGCEFGADECVRLSYATSMANIEKGVSRMAEFMAKLA